MKRILSALICVTTFVVSAAEANSLAGASITARNTIQVEEPLAGAFGLPAGVEVDFVPTTDPIAVAAGVELDSFATVYDIDFDANSVTFTFDLADDSPVTPRVLEAGTFDRYYFDVIFPDPSMQLASVEFDAASSNVLDEATATPLATLISGTSFSVELGPGNGVLPGFVHAYNVSVVPEPASCTQVMLAVFGLMLVGRTFRQRRPAR